MSALVTEDGRYHGHVDPATNVHSLAIVKDRKCRLLSDAEWDTVVGNPDKRVSLCSSLGEVISSGK